MSAFGALQSSSDSSDDEDGREQESLQMAASSGLQGAGAQGPCDADEDTEGGWLPVRPKALEEGDATCFVCSRGFSRRSKAISIPCAALCNPAVQIHRYCLNQWRERNASCPLCRAALTESAEPAPRAESAEVAETDGGVSVEGELDVKARRALPSRRDGKTHTFKASQQRHYAKAKRDAQRAQAKAASGAWAEEGEDDGW